MSASSFPPSFSSFPDLDTLSNSKSERAASTKDHKQDKKKKEESLSKRRREDEKKHEKEGNKKKSRRGSRDRPPPREDPSTAPEKSRQVEQSRFFYSDRRGDPLNIQYGGLHAGDIPRYHVVDHTRNVLGLPSSFIIHRRAGKGVEVGLSTYRKMSALTDSSTRALLKKAPTRLMPSTSGTEFQEEDGIIRLPSRKGPKKPEDSYRSIAGKLDFSDSDASSSSEIEDSSCDEGDDQLLLTAHQITLKSLEEDLAVNPADADKWLALLRQTLSTVPITSKNATQARCEITIALLSRALSTDPRNAGNKMLRILYLKAGEEVWHESKVKAEWEEAFKDGDIEILMEWLEWRIRRGTGGLELVVDSAIKALSRFGMSEDDEVAKVRIFWRVAFAIRSAGYSERAMAMFQAQAELMFYRPLEVSKLAFQVQLDELEEFWESEVPRIGEAGAKGWNMWHPTEVTQEPPPPLPIPSVPPDLDPYRDWAKRESHFDTKVLLPSRSHIETSDPYSTVLFSDIRPMILDVHSHQAKEGFRFAWLSFLGFHVPGFRLAHSTDFDWDDRWNQEFLTRPAYLNAIFPSGASQKQLMTNAVAGVVIGREREYGSPFGPVRSWGYGAAGSLDLASAQPGKSQQRGVWSRNDIADVNEGIIRRVFASLKIVKDDVEWDSFALSFELAVDPKNATKASKTLLSTNQDYVELWGAHAQLERLRGRLEEVRKVYQTILVVSKPSSIRNGIGRMWWNWAEMEWLAGDERQSLNVILKSVHLEGSSSGVTILRAKRLLEDLVDSIPSTNWKDREAWIRMRALLELFAGSQPTSVVAIIDRYLDVGRRGVFNESLTVSALLMLYYHGVVLRNPMPPSILRERAYAAFEEYPSNSIILGILLEAEKGQGSWGRLRTMLGSNDGKVKDVARRVEEVWITGWERGRWLNELERTRSGLAAAIEHERTRSSPVIWRIYIEFEIRSGQLQRAKQLLFRAIGECPMVKGVYLLAFGPLRSVFTSHELNALADTMAERGLRLHQGLDELLDGMDIVEDDEKRGCDDSDIVMGELDEVERDSKELRRLKPY